MEEYFIYLINNFSLEIFLMSLAIFIVTMLIKIPIKRATSKLEESKRQSLNSLIIFIPLALAFIACAIYFLIVKRQILSLDYLSCALSTCIISITIYHTYARIKIIIKGIFSGRTVIKAEDIKESILSLTQVVEDSQKTENQTSKEEKLNDIKDKINTLISFKEKLESQGGVENITALNETNNEIKLLQNEQEKLLTKN